jgi:hypothetical protein
MWGARKRLAGSAPGGGPERKASMKSDFMDLPGVVNCWAIGSKVTCIPPPENTDTDWLVLFRSLQVFLIEAKRNGWVVGGSLNGGDVPNDEDVCYEGTEGGMFISLTHSENDDNLVVTTSEKFKDRFLLATHVAKNLNLLNKHDRIVLFQAVLYNNAYE